MNTPNFSSILDRTSTGKVERPKALPVGTYYAVVDGPPRQDKSSKKGTPFVEFKLKLIQAGEDVDADDLERVLTRADGSTKNIQDLSVNATFYLTEDALWRLDEFLIEDLEIDMEGRTRASAISDAIGKQVMVTLKHEPSDDGQIYHRIRSTAKVA